MSDRPDRQHPALPRRPPRPRPEDEAGRRFAHELQLTIADIVDEATTSTTRSARPLLSGPEARGAAAPPGRSAPSACPNISAWFRELLSLGGRAEMALLARRWTTDPTCRCSSSSKGSSYAFPLRMADAGAADPSTLRSRPACELPELATISRATVASLQRGRPQNFTPYSSGSLAIAYHCHTDLERRVMRGWRWFSRAELAGHDEPVFPGNLLDMLERIEDGD